MARTEHLPGEGLRLSAYGEGGLLVVVPGSDPEQRWRATQALAAALRAEHLPGLVDVVATYDALLLTHDPDQVSAADLGQHVRSLLVGPPPTPVSQGRVVEVPVVFGADAGPDLADVAAHLGVTPGEVVERLTAAPWTVRFVASPVGSPFTEREDWREDVPRLGSPRVAVPAGSLALSGAQAMIYPVASPGGWRLVGRVPTPLVKLSPEGPSVPYAAGDLLHLVAVDPGAHPPGVARRPAAATRSARPRGHRPGPPPHRRTPATRPPWATCRHGEPGDSTQDPAESPVLHVLEAGRATLQDLGRPGLGHLGVAVNGAPARGSATLANLLVGNAAGASLVEVTASGARFRAGADLLVAVTGALARPGSRPGPGPRLDGKPAPTGEPFVLRSGAELELPAPTDGVRTYLAVAGGWATPGGASAAARPDGLLNRVAGSVSPDAGLGIGHLLGPGDVLVAGACMCGWTQPHGVEPAFRLDGTAATSAPVRTEDGAQVVEVTAGPELADFDPTALRGPWTVSASSDHVGLRLDGPSPRRVRPAPRGATRSRGVPVGAVEVPPQGGLLALLPGRLVTAGYPVPCVATSLALDVLGQARPGDRLELRPVSLEQALESRRRRTRAYADLARRVRTALTASGLGHLPAPEQGSAPQATV